MSSPDFKTPTSRAVTLWLLLTLLMVALMIVLGGATRLTNSGLSITEWKPITGALPPLSHEAWLSEFEKYKQIPEFAAEHSDMSLKGFEFIYFMEWSHRQLGRLIGLVYTLPFFVFLLRGRLRGKAYRYAAIVGLIGLQGAIGWWMVHSGLAEGQVDVSQYRLATHLALAFFILGLLFWLWRDSVEDAVKEDAVKEDAVTKMTKSTGVLAGLIYLQVIAGAFVAGTHSGKTYNTWPLMDGGFVPSGYFATEPKWRAVFENAAAIQFNHRLLAYIITAFVIYLWFRAHKSPHLKTEHLKTPMTVLALLIFAQVVLGIWTLLAVAPLALSLAHQFSAILVFLAGIWSYRRAVMASKV